MKYVLIVEQRSGKVIKKMGPMGDRKADRVSDGAEINLNHEEYFVRIIDAAGRGEGV